MSTETPLEVTVQQVQQLRDAGARFLLIDCREEDEYQIARIDGATLLPMSQLAGRIDELAPHRQEQIVVHCHHGGRSLRVARWLRGQGFSHAQSMAGGIDQWSSEIDPAVPRY
jgi:rhodanese-related sulfurtransferase